MITTILAVVLTYVYLCGMGAMFLLLVMSAAKVELTQLMIWVVAILFWPFLITGWAIITVAAIMSMWLRETWRRKPNDYL